MTTSTHQADSAEEIVKLLTSSAVGSTSEIQRRLSHILIPWNAGFLLMSLKQTGDDREDGADDGERPEVSEGVLQGIDDIAEGETVSKEDLEALLKY